MGLSKCTLIPKFLITQHNLPVVTTSPPSQHFQSGTLLWLVSSPIVSQLYLLEESLLRKYCVRAREAGFGNILNYFLARVRLGIFRNKNVFRNIFRLFCCWEQNSQNGIQVFRNENSSQTNAYLHHSNYSYSGLIPNERALRHTLWSMPDFLPFAASLTIGLLPLNFEFARC